MPDVEKKAPFSASSERPSKTGGGAVTGGSGEVPVAGVVPGASVVVGGTVAGAGCDVMVGRKVAAVAAVVVVPLPPQEAKRLDATTAAVINSLTRTFPSQGRLTRTL